jgi:hypothetical protein
MSTPNGGLITETNIQYYEGAQQFFISTLTQGSVTTTFNTDLILGSADSWNPNDSDYALNNFLIFTSANGITFLPYITSYTVVGNTITFPGNLPQFSYVRIQLKSTAVENNYGSYEYTKLNDIINNFIVGYVGQDKLIPRVNRTDVIFHAKRGLQEFSFDTLKSIKSQELSVPGSLSVPMPQDYVNYVKMSWVDAIGVKHTIYPTQLTSSPSETPLQDNFGDIIQDQFGENTEGSSQTDERWAANNPANITGANINNNGLDWWGMNSWGYGFQNYGQRYGGDPVNMQTNGWFTINESTGTISFSSDLANKLILLEYISDGLAYDLDTKVPKMAESAMYAHLSYSILSTRANVQEYVVQRYKKQRSSELRNAKIRLSNIKLDEIVQVMRGKSKWIKS